MIHNKTIGVCAGCYDNIFSNEKYYQMETKKGIALIHCNVDCCVDFVSENATIQTPNLPKITHNHDTGKILNFTPYYKKSAN